MHSSREDESEIRDEPKFKSNTSVFNERSLKSFRDATSFPFHSASRFEPIPCRLAKLYH